MAGYGSEPVFIVNAGYGGEPVFIVGCFPKSELVRLISGMCVPIADGL
jgi:hypothetical protein